MVNEKRLIDARPIVQFVMDGLNNPDKMKAFGHDAIEILAEIEYAPTVDAVEVTEYDAIVSKLENLLCHATGGKYSKAGYAWEDMERMVTDYIQECCEEAVAEEVVHTSWHDVYLMTPWIAIGVCSHCNLKSYINPDFPWAKYCPNCGAKMDGGNAGEQ